MKLDGSTREIREGVAEEIKSASLEAHANLLAHMKR